jgi:hypothetical protein
VKSTTLPSEGVPLGYGNPQGGNPEQGIQHRLLPVGHPLLGAQKLQGAEKAQDLLPAVRGQVLGQVGAHGEEALGAREEEVGGLVAKAGKGRLDLGVCGEEEEVPHGPLGEGKGVAEAPGEEHEPSRGWLEVEGGLPPA